MPAPQLAAWLQAMFINERSKLYNPDHAHLADANIGVLWTSAKNSRGGRVIHGTAEIPRPPSGMSKWHKARWDWQMRGWFGDVIPDFILTFYLPFVLGATDAASVFALFEHELYHCGQAIDEFGEPRFRKSDGRPVWTIVAHDVEEHIGVVRRYGAKAAGVGALVEAALREPEISEALILAACGTCGRRAA